MTTVAIASDHAGFALKTELQRLLNQYQWVDMGPNTDERVDYPDFAARVAHEVVSGRCEAGILVCGSGIGMSIAANKHAGIRAAYTENPVSARLARQHNHANILCLGARFLAAEYAAEITRVFLDTPYSDDPRHQRRVDKLTALDSKGSRS